MISDTLVIPPLSGLKVDVNHVIPNSAKLPSLVMSKALQSEETCTMDLCTAMKFALSLHMQFSELYLCTAEALL